MKSVNVQQVEGGYIVATEDYKVKIFTNFGAVVKALREQFGEQRGKNEAEGDVPQPTTTES